jgi:Holliday junction resolvase RusA-like endonuclease
MRIEIKPLSVNEVWQGKRFKTPKYKQYERDMLLMLPPLKLDFKNPLKIDLIFGFSSKLADLDNPIKPILDILQKKYKFNDNQVQELNIKKEIVKKNQEFIKLEINEL